MRALEGDGSSAGWRSAIVVVGLGISLWLVAPPLATSAPQQPAAAGTNGGFATQHQVIAASGEQRVDSLGTGQRRRQLLARRARPRVGAACHQAG